jgi:tetraprenyl-beta-curcumene synthase
MHAARSVGDRQLRVWASEESRGTGLGWRELLAGAASSVLAVHALIAAAADPRTTSAQAGEIAEAYLYIGVLITTLDSLVDHGPDIAAGEPGFVRLYEDLDQLPATLGSVARRATAGASALQHNPVEHPPQAVLADHHRGVRLRRGVRVGSRARSEGAGRAHAERAR